MRPHPKSCLWLALLLTACPGQTPSAEQFATDVAGLDTQAADLASAPDAAADLASADALPADAPPADTVPADTLPTDTADAQPADTLLADADAAGEDSADTTAPDPPDSAGAKGICPTTANLGLFAKSLDNGASDSLYAVVATSDGGALLIGETGASSNQTDLWVVRIGPLGNKLWSKSHGIAGEEKGYAGLALGGGFVVAGLTRAKGAGNADGWLVRLDLQGGLLWDKTYGGASTDFFAGIAGTQDGGFVLAGSNRSLGNGLEDGWLVRTDAAGSVLWQSKYGGSQNDEFTGVIALPGGGVAAVGLNASDASMGTDAWLVLVDALGKPTTSKVFGHGEGDDARAIALLPAGGFVLTGKASDKGNPMLWTLRTDAAGNLLAKDVVGGNQSESGRAVTVWPDGSFAVVGETDSNLADGSSTGQDGWLLRYDAAGNRLWDQRYGGAGNQWLSGVVPRPDGGVLMVGRRFESGTSFDGWVIRTDPWGNADCGSVAACKNLVAKDCDDGLPCTVDTCQNIGGCTHSPLPDGSACGKGGVCGAGQCIGG